MEPWVPRRVRKEGGGEREIERCCTADGEDGERSQAPTGAGGFWNRQRDGPSSAPPAAWLS